ncbi:hypothetical protein C7B62_07375 [Pleurocapsa sp. CCALA 161]|uniref:hypothetical protein n=1 Tax=Pleurocapsa sp. CCALA 161 TaxID=2107688 RepID=UPI000D0653FF|nr:hypothetical protein [Pleurocapsa sp. CCALA 161]PSB10940.1 hypothetical protein C7B62_07375 [Pleurocapsa sp. CCALA 161]
MTFYLLGAGTYCTFLLLSKFKDRECSKTELKSWGVIAIASTLWIVVIPICLIEIKTQANAKQHSKNKSAIAKTTNQLKEITSSIQ